MKINLQNYLHTTLEVNPFCAIFYPAGIFMTGCRLSSNNVNNCALLETPASENRTFRPHFKVIYELNRGTIASFFKVYKVAKDGATEATKVRHILVCMTRDDKETLATNIYPGKET